jgi:hypothetical protein
MSKLPTPNPGPRKFDSTSAGQNLLLVFAVVAAAVFAYLYIADKQRKPAREAEPTMAQPPPAAKPVEKTIVSHEPTHIEVEQVLLVAPSAGAPTEKVIVRTPAVYPTGTLQWTAGQVETARALQARLVNVLRHQAAIDRELARIEGEWQRLALEGLPLEALFPDSPSLPQLSPSQPIPPTP